MHRYDIIVVGAGPAGCAAAITAARAGARVCVLDRSTFPRPKACGDAVSNRAALIVDELGGGNRLLETVPHAEVRGAAAVLPDGTRIERDFAGQPGYIVPRLHLDELLRRRLELEHVSVFENVRVRSLLAENGRVIGADAGESRWHAPVVIAADGASSVGWAALDHPVRGGRHLGVAITAYFEGIDNVGAEGINEHYFEVGLPCGYGWIFPEVEGRSNIGIYQRQDHFAGGGESLTTVLDRFIAAHPERFRSARQVGRTRKAVLPLAVRPSPPGGPGLLLAGDAACSIDPLSGEGIRQALSSGCTAGEIAARALESGGLDSSWVRRFQLKWAREIGLASLGRLVIQEGMRVLVNSEAYRWPMIRRALVFGYGTGGKLASRVDSAQ